MIKPEELRSATENVLSGLTADESLKFRILQKAASDTQNKHIYRFSPVPVLCSVLAVLIISIIALNTVKPVDPTNPGEMNVFAAGSKDTALPETVSPDNEFSVAAGGITPEDIISIEMTDVGRISVQSQSADLFRILCNSAVAVSGINPDPVNCLNITTSDGRVITFDVKEPYLISDSCWLCPEFFNQLHIMLE